MGFTDWRPVLCANINIGLSPLTNGAAKGEGEKLPPYGWTSKNYVICVCFHCLETSSYHTTNTLQGRRAKSHVDTQTIQPGRGTSYSRPHIDPYLTSPLLQNLGGATAINYVVNSTFRKIFNTGSQETVDVCL